MGNVKILYQIWIVTFVFLLVLAGEVKARMQHEVFLEGTDHELHVYKVTGAEPGPTLMILGGIQGDEPSGYLTADLYTDITLRKGNLIVVPRANFYSILSNNRIGVTGDMNRMFAEEQKISSELDLDVVGMLKQLIHQSDCLVNLHEGSGFYSAEWVSEQENSKRFGQSIVYDAEIYQPKGMASPIPVGKLAKDVVNEVNRKIVNKRYHFRPNNHDTLSDLSQHTEQRASASFYALTKAHIPAFGIEISKSIQSLQTKVHLTKLVVNEMMKALGVQEDHSGRPFPSPKLSYLLLQVNDNYPIALADGAVLNLSPGDEVAVLDIIANYKRGLVADIAGFGSVNDTKRRLTFEGPTRIVVKKDSLVCGWVDLVAVGKSGEASGRDRYTAQIDGEKSLSVSDLKAESLTFIAGGKFKKIDNLGTIVLPKAEQFVLKAITTNMAMMDNEVIVNLKGFVPPKSVNDGNDLGYPINLKTDLWQKYSVGGKGVKYPINITYLGREVGQFWVELTD